jgi:hypothetical protein
MNTVATHITIIGIAFALLLSLFPTNIFLRSVFAQPLVHGVKTNSSTLASLRNATISVHTENIIQANSFNILNKERALVKKSVFSNIDNVILIAKGGVKNTIPVIVNAKIINQLDNNRIDTTQGVNMTKSLIATELANAISAIIPTNSITSSQQQPRVVVDNQAFCSGMGTTGAACAFTIGIRK